MLKKFVSYYRPHKKLFILTLLGAVFIALLNLIYPVVAREIIDNDDRTLRLVLILSALLLSGYAIRTVLVYNVNYWGHVLGVRIQGDMRRDLFLHLQKLPFKYYDENRTGSIMTRMTNDLWEIGELAHHMPEDLLLSSVTITGSLIILGILASFWMVLIVLSIIPIMIAFAVIRRKKMKDAFKKAREKVAEINAGVESSISGIRVSKAYTASKKEIEKFELSNNQYQHARRNALKNMALFFGGMGFFNNFLYLAAIGGGAILLIYGDVTGVSRGDFALFVFIIAVMIQPIGMFVGIFEQIQNGITGFGRFVEILNVEPESDCADPIEVDALNGDIEFKNISFSYKSKDGDMALGQDDGQADERDKTKIIKNLSLAAKEGKTIAFVGPSGGGKTTLCHLIPRFYEIDEGQICIGGLDVTKIKREVLRKNVGIVAQDVFLFSGSIKENIAYGDLDASDEMIIEAAKRANIHDFVLELPKGYDTQVGERGVKLSGGQKQRVSIARAFLKNPPILILDEATSALDNVSEMQIQSSLDELSKGRTTIVVAHRLSTIKNADLICVLTQEGIVEKGTHEQLIKSGGLYSTLYSLYG